MVLGHGRRLQVLQDEQVRRGRLQVLHAEALHEEGAGTADDGEQVRPEGNLRLAGATACCKLQSYIMSEVSRVSTGWSIWSDSWVGLTLI